MKMNHCLLFLMLGLITACSTKNVYDGEGMVNYPDMVSILKDNVFPYQTGAYVYQQVIQEKGKKDTLILKAIEVDWNAMKAPFLEADIFKKEFDRMYKLDLFEDLNAQTKTYHFSALDKKAKTTKMSVLVRDLDNAVVSVYAETNEVGFFNSKSYKLLLATGKSIQIQEKSKRAFKDPVQRITTLTFLN